MSDATSDQSGRTLIDWRPEDDNFWKQKGKSIATRNLWLSIPALLLAFSVWMVWSVVVAKLPAIGFQYTTSQLFWLAGGFSLAIGLHGTFNLIAGAGGTIPLLAYCVLLVGLFLHLRQRTLGCSPFRALIRLITEGEGKWPYPRAPLSYLFAEGFSWPGKNRGGMFQAFPLSLSLIILYPLLVVAVYLINRLLVWLLPI